MKIFIGADIVPTESNAELFVSSNVEKLIGTELKTLLDSADFRIFNLEVPLTNTVSPIKKAGPNLIAPTETIHGIKNIGADLLTLANNHIMDQGEQGLNSTVNTLKENEIPFFGIGETLTEASKPYIFELNGIKIGVYACAEHEFSIATEEKPGANPFDALESFDHVFNLKSECDKVIVLYHGGKEHYRYPSPMLQKVCRKFVEKGADIVVCQHSHCIGCEEKYKQGTIVYGQGNFLFDHSNSEFWQTSLLISIEDNFNISYIPLVKNGNGVKLAEGEQKETILSGFVKRTSEILNDGFVENEYKKFAESMQERYLIAFSGGRYNSLVFRALNKLSGGNLLHRCLKRRYNKNKKLVLRNYIECEAHRELFLRNLLDK